MSHRTREIKSFYLAEGQVRRDSHMNELCRCTKASELCELELITVDL
jgi:hypothetical protein